jgi:hypothetical protein
LNFNSEFNDIFIVDSPKEILKFSVSDSYTKRANERRAYTSQTIKWKKIDVKE